MKRYYVSAFYKTTEAVPWGSLDEALRLAGGYSDGAGTDMSTGERDIGFPKDTLEDAEESAAMLRAVHPTVRVTITELED